MGRCTCFYGGTWRYTSGSVDSFSYIRGAELPLIEKTLSQALADTAGKFPEREALIVSQQNVRYTWAELDREATRVARGLAGLGLGPDDRAGIWASNCVEWVLLQYAAARAGVVLVNVNPAYRSHELRYVLHKSRMRALFLRGRDARADYRAILAESRNGDALPLEHVVWLGDGSWQEMLDGGCDYAEDAAGPHDVANIQYTSGTTGSPKGVMLSHHNLLNNGMAMGRGLRATERDRICAPVPLVSLFRVGDRVDGVGGVGRGADSAERAVRRTGDAGGGAPGAGHGAVWRADDVHRGVGPRGVWALRLDEPAHGSDGGGAVPDRNHEAGGGADAHSGADDHLRADGGLAGDHDVERGRSAGGSGYDGGEGAAEHGGADRGSGDAGAVAGGTDRANCARAATW